MRIMSDLMRRPHTEVLINFMFEEINRFLNHPDQPKNFDELFASCDWRHGYSLNGFQRKNYLHDLYRDQLRKAAGARYVRSFEMLNDRGMSDYFLFFATKSLRGLGKMKEAMWKVDPGGGAHFSDTTNLDQYVLLQPEPDRRLLRKQLLERFSSRRVRVMDVEQFVIEHTAFHAGHYKKVLADLETTNFVNIINPAPKRRRGTFPDGSMILEFA